MSAGRIFPAVVISFWIASMAWLIQTKVIPLMAVHATPVSHAFPEAGSAEPIQDRWIIQWNRQSIGSVQTKAFRDLAHGQIDVIVSLDDAPADEMLRAFFGPANQLIKMAARDFQTNSLNLRITSAMFFDYQGRLENFTSRVYLGGIGDLFQLDGHATATHLQIDVTAVGEFWPESFPTNLLTHRFELPNDAFVSDAFSPPTELADLSVGKSWHYHTYRALSPNQPLQLVRARVESVETIGWHGNVETVFVVKLRNDGNDLSFADDEVGKMWVRGDGLVLRQSLRLGNLEIVFLRDDSQQANTTTSRPAHAQSSVHD
jgi:hypothetical protein